MDLTNLQEKIGNWHQQTFGDDPKITNLIIDKIDEEVNELACAHDDGIAVETEEEAADVAIALLAFCHRKKIDLQAQILKKHAVNQKRVWTKTADGFKRDKNPNSVT